MAVDMPEPNARNNVHAPWQVKIRRLLNPLVEMLVVLTIYVIECEFPIDPIGIVPECLK
jgi:hypothetical protein